MTTTQPTSKTTRQQANWPKVALIIAGLLLTFGWAILVASNDSLINLSATISPHASDQGSRLATITLRTPLIIGSILLPIGIVYGQKVKLLYRLLTVALSALVLYYTAFYLMVFLGIAIHGLGPR